MSVILTDKPDREIQRTRTTKASAEDRRPRVERKRLVEGLVHLVLFFAGCYTTVACMDDDNFRDYALMTAIATLINLAFALEYLDRLSPNNYKDEDSKDEEK